MKAIKFITAECLADSSQDHLPRVPHQVDVSFTDGSTQTFRISAGCPQDAIEMIRRRLES